MTQQTTGPCSVRACSSDGVCLDTKNYTQTRADLLPDNLFKDDTLDDDESKVRQIWFCQEHATKYLFPLIEHAVGFTMGKILEDFRSDEMM